MQRDSDALPLSELHSDVLLTHFLILRFRLQVGVCYSKSMLNECMCNHFNLLFLICFACNTS